MKKPMQPRFLPFIYISLPTCFKYSRGTSCGSCVMQEVAGAEILRTGSDDAWKMRTRLRARKITVTKPHIRRYWGWYKKSLPALSTWWLDIWPWPCTNPRKVDMLLVISNFFFFCFFQKRHIRTVNDKIRVGIYLVYLNLRNGCSLLVEINKI